MNYLATGQEPKINNTRLSIDNIFDLYAIISLCESKLLLGKLEEQLYVRFIIAAARPIFSVLALNPKKWGNHE